MPVNIKVLFSSFTIKLFVWFWLIAIISIVSTRFISQQLSNDAFYQVNSSTTEPKELHKLRSIARRIEASKPKSLTDFITKKHKRAIQGPFNLWFKSIEQPQQITSLLALPPRHQQALTNHLGSQAFSQIQTSILAHTRITGPVEIEINNQSYQLFISRKQHPRRFGQLVQAMPYWARITIPAFISFILCLLLAHSFSKPVRLIKKATTKLGQGQFDTRVEGMTKRNDELGQLANSFNEMAEQLQQHQSAQQRLLGDVSHELRSPLTRLQMAIGLAQQELTSEQARQQYLQRCQREITRLDKMIENVLVLSRLENTIQTITFQHVNINALVQDIINDEQFVANKKSITIELSKAKTINILADQALLASAISNVLSNAVKYSPEQSTISVILSSDKEAVSLVISDQGDGVPEQSLSKLFSPFYRVTLARDRDTGGTGLGLAIAKQAIDAHQGKIFAKNNAVKGLSVTIQLPYLK